MSRQFIKHFVTFITLLFSTQLLMSFPANAKVVRLDEVDLAGKHYPYLYQWSDPEFKPKAIILAIHGITLHGLVYENLASHLAQEGALVLAPDLPGCGRRWQIDSVSYLKAQKDLTDIIQSAKSTYKDIPVILLGESLGANLSLTVAQHRPDLVDGLILSSPALKRRVNVSPKIVVGSMNLLLSFVKADTEVDLSPYVRAYASEDPVIIQTMLADPLIHRQVKGQDLWNSCQAMKNVFKHAKLVSKTTPVLIIQGSQDKILKADAIIKLVSTLSCEDQTVKWFNDRGHMLIEECQPKADILQTIDTWFKVHVDKPIMEVKSTEKLPVTSSLPPLTEATLNATNNTD